MFSCVPSYRVVKLWVLLRRPLLLLLVLGCFVSIEASGRFSARLVADGMISFAFVPIVEATSFALVWRSHGRPMAFPLALDRFCASDLPWLLWLLAFMAVRAIESPLQAASLPAWAFWMWGLLLVAAAIRAVQLDLHFFRTTIAPARPLRALFVQRGVAWTGALGYFFGIAAWSYVVGYL